MANNEKPLPLDKRGAKRPFLAGHVCNKIHEVLSENVSGLFPPDMYSGSLTMRRHSISTTILN